ncbi:MAG: hypothetical protein ABI183_01825 [Polyangiaceae bacterium]
MSDEKKKRKLNLMPEVLPDPRLAKKDRDAAPRERTIAHMKRLLALTAGATAVAACTKGYAVVDPLPPPGTATIGPPIGPPDAGIDAESPFGPFVSPDDAAKLGSMDDGGAQDAGVDAGAKKKRPPIVSTVPTRGYMVVDPLPLPTSMTIPKNRKP